MAYAQAAYEKLKAENKPRNAKKIQDPWVADVERRCAEDEKVDEPVLIENNA